MSVLTRITPRTRMLGLLVITAALGLLNLLSEPVTFSSEVATQQNDDIVLPTQRIGSAMSVLTAYATEPRPMLEPARRNPFVVQIPQAPVPKAPPVKAVGLVIANPLPPTVPTAPPLNLSFAGRVRDPDGKESIYLTWGDKTLSAELGSVLPNGYRVESITADAIDLLYVELNTPARLALPAAPRYEIR
ncbi:hypothetical protein MCEMSHM24_02457 [Comamonadaceae bacterium]